MGHRLSNIHFVTVIIPFLLFRCIIVLRSSGGGSAVRVRDRSSSSGHYGGGGGGWKGRRPRGGVR